MTVMVEMRPSLPSELAEQKRLWKLAFGDEDGYIDFFYTHCAGPEDVLVLLEGGALRSMLALLPVTLAFPDGSTASSAYVYALATDPAERKKGFGRQLLRYTDFYLRERLVDCVTVVPAEAGLHKFFATVDFAECFSTRKLEVLEAAAGTPAPGDGAEPVGPEAYNALRERLLSGTSHAVYGEGVMRFQDWDARHNGGGLYRLRVGDAEGCAVAQYSEHGTAVAVKELLLPPQAQAGGVACLARHLPADRYFVRTPALWEGLPGSYLQPFAMVKWINQGRRLDWGGETAAYFGLALD